MIFSKIHELRKNYSPHSLKKKITRGCFIGRRKNNSGGKYEVHEAMTSKGNK